MERGALFGNFTRPRQAPDTQKRQTPLFLGYKAGLNGFLPQLLPLTLQGPQVAGSKRQSVNWLWASGYRAPSLWSPVREAHSRDGPWGSPG